MSSSATLLTVHGNLQARILEWVAFLFPTQRSNLSLPRCKQILYQLSHKGSPRILELVAYPFSSVSSWPGNWTRVFCIVGRFFNNWATRRQKKKEDNSQERESRLTTNMKRYSASFMTKDMQVKSVSRPLACLSYLQKSERNVGFTDDSMNWQDLLRNILALSVKF